MSKKSDYYIELWKAVISLRDPLCPICGAIATECHHIFFRSQGNRAILFDSDYGVKLCYRCHHKAPYAPHQNNNLFFERIIPRLLQIAPERGKKILKYRSSVKKPNTSPPTWKDISDKLRKERKRLEKTAYMDADIDCSRGASI